MSTNPGNTIPGNDGQAADPEPPADAIRARVKWFSGDKGFGFVAPLDGAPDAFLHVSALKAAGLPEVAEGAEVLCRLAQGPKGPQVVEVCAVEHGSSGQALELAGQVKWFAPEKGFGFVVADDGGRDVFVHKSVLRRCGLEALAERQRVRVHAADTPKGREALWIGLE